MPDPEIEVGLLTAVAAAIRDTREMRFDYGRSGVQVQPYRLVSWQRRWYLVGRDGAYGGWATYRLDWMRLRTPGGPRFTRSSCRAGTTRPSCCVMSPFTGWKVHARIAVDAPAAEVLARINPAVGVVEAVDERSCVLVTGADSVEIIAVYIGMLGLDFQVDRAARAGGSAARWSESATGRRSRSRKDRPGAFIGSMTAMPAEVRAEVDEVAGAVVAQVPAKAADNLLIATWNLRAFGNLTAAWNAGAGSRPKRDWRAVALIAAMVSHFDVIAVQEVRRNLTALRFLISQLGPGWRLVTSDVTVGDDGNDERLTFVYDSTRVQPSGLVGEIVLPPTLNQPGRQFARSPYAVSFRRAEVDFILTTAHIIWGGRPEDRLPEITELARWMRTWADRRNDWNVNLLVLGDFNLDRLGNPLFDAFVSTGLWPPAELNDIPRTIFDNNRSRHFYDQIAWFTDVDADPPVELLTEMTYTRRAGSFDFLPHVFSGLTARDISWRISDHYPLWAEFRL